MVISHKTKSRLKKAAAIALPIAGLALYHHHNRKHRPGRYGIPELSPTDQAIVDEALHGNHFRIWNGFHNQTHLLPNSTFHRGTPHFTVAATDTLSPINLVYGQHGYGVSDTIKKAASIGIPIAAGLAGLAAGAHYGKKAYNKRQETPSSFLSQVNNLNDSTWT